MVLRPRPRVGKATATLSVKKGLRKHVFIFSHMTITMNYFTEYKHVTTGCIFPASGIEPMYWSSFMTSSMQLAKECLSQKLTDDIGESFQPFEGLEKFAETIETGTLCL